MTAAESIAWQRAIARVIVEEESRLPHRHLIAQNVANFRLSFNDDDLVPEAASSISTMPIQKQWTGSDETGFAGKADVAYRQQAWNFVLSGGALFNNLDYSFTVGHEDGTDTANNAPGGGSPALRRQLKVLSDFLRRFRLAELEPDTSFVQRAPGVVVRALTSPGRAYALYAQGRGPSILRMNLPAGRYRCDWLGVEDGCLLKRTTVTGDARRPVALASPDFSDAVALCLMAE